MSMVMTGGSKESKSQPVILITPSTQLLLMIRGSPEVPLADSSLETLEVSRATTAQLRATSSLTPSSKDTPSPHLSKLGMTFPACMLPACPLGQASLQHSSC